MLSWHYVTRAVYDAAEPENKTADKIFFLSDTKEIYRGTENFTESVILYSEELESGAVGKLYVNSTTLEGKIWNGTSWTTVIQPVQATLSNTDTAKPVSGKAVADYVSSAIEQVTGSGDLVADVTYTPGTNTLNVQMADGSSDQIPLTNVAAQLHYDAETGALTLRNAAGTTVGSAINLDLERFVSSASYDHESHTIKLAFNDEDTPLSIDVGDLVDTYTAGNTQSVTMQVTGNQFTAEVLLATDEQYSGNLIQATSSGLYVAPVDLSGKIDVVASATAGNVATLTAAGGVQDSGVVVGGATIAGSPNATTLATEAAVAAIRTALQASIDAKMAKVGTGHTNEIITADANGDASASGVKVGGAAFNGTPNAATVATELGTATYVQNYAVAKVDVVAAGNMAANVAAASDTKVTSEKAVVDALTWKTTV